MSDTTNVESILFVDAMDSTRFMRIIEVKENTVVCKVFTGENKDALGYVGKTELPKRLFYPGDERDYRTGFNPWQPPQVAPPPRTYDRRGRDEE